MSELDACLDAFDEEANMMTSLADDSLAESTLKEGVVEDGNDDDEDVDDDDEEEEEDDDDDDDDDEEDDDDDDDDEEDDEEDEKPVEEGAEEFKVVSSTPTSVKPISLKLRRSSPQPAAPATTTNSDDNEGHLPPPKKRGRPSKAEMLRRRGEKSEDIPVLPKRRGRRPMPKEEKERLKAEKKEKKRRERMEKRNKNDGSVRRKPGRKALVLTEEEKEKREQARRAKYEEFKRAKAEKAAKRAERNEQLKIQRKKRKEEETKQREAYEKRMQELKASFLDENTQMSAALNGSQVAEDMEMSGLMDETSQSSVSSFNRRNWGVNEMNYLDKIKDVTSETLFEYKWPLDGKNAEYFFLQEQVCEYLGVKSFKRRYPDVVRRKIDIEERDFLVEMKVVNETQADLGLTAIPSSEVLDIMSRDFYDKYDEYMVVVNERKDRNQRLTSYNTVTVEKHKLADFVEKAIRSTAEWNKNMNKDVRENRKAYFDLQTYNVHYPKNNRGRMRVLPKAKLGHYPIAIIPGQFTDHYRTYTPLQLKYMPLNSTLAGPPQSGTRIDALDSGADSDSSSSSSSEDSNSSADDSSSSSESEAEETAPPKKIDYEKPGAKCKICQGDRQRNKIGIPEKLLHCSKCDQSAHPTCVGLSLELLQYVTNYDWECTDCKKCSKCKDHTDEDKMLFCDLCDRGYHIFCVGLDDVPSGRWHCVECSYCTSCSSKEPHGGDMSIAEPKWVLEYKPGNQSRIYSHTMCMPCYKLTKKGQFCPECNKVFGRENTTGAMESELLSCWVCARQHHSSCVGQANFICYSCQRKTKDKTVGAGKTSFSGSNFRRISSANSY